MKKITIEIASMIILESKRHAEKGKYIKTGSYKEQGIIGGVYGKMN